MVSRSSNEIQWETETVLSFLMLHVRWKLMWNVTQHQLGKLQPLTVTGSSELPAFFSALKLQAAGLFQS